MDLKQKLYQMFILGTDGDGYKEALKNGLGGIIFFTKDIQNPEQFKSLIDSINSKALIKPFLSIDQEGGRVERTENIHNGKKYLSAKFAYEKGEELEQQKMRDNRVLEDVKESNEKGVPSSYSEEQILKAQEQHAKKEINRLYDEKINPNSNGIIYFVYCVFNLFILPFLFFNEGKYKGIVAIGAWALLFIVVIVNKLVEIKYQKEMHKDMKGAKYFNKFEFLDEVVEYNVYNLQKSDIYTKYFGILLKPL